MTLSPQLYSQDFDDLNDQLSAIQHKYNIAGVSLIIVDEKETLNEAFLGVANRETKQEVNADTVFRVGSITKTFTSLAALKLQELGKLNIDDKVSDYVTPPYDNTYPESPIRIAHLLEHTAGFQDMDATEWNFKQPDWTLEQSFNYSPSSRTTRWEPGIYSSYTNSGAGIAAYVMEKASGQIFEEFVQTEVLNPLELRDATFYLDESIKDRLAVGYNKDGESVIPYWNMLYRPFGAMNMRASEMGIFIRMLINQGLTDSGKRIFNKESIQRLETPNTTLAAQEGLNYGYGLGNYHWIRDGVVFHGHGGDADGYLAHYGYSRENNLGYFLVINAFNEHALRNMRRAVEQSLIQSVNKTQPPVEYKLNQSELNQIIGNYYAATERFVWNPDALPNSNGTSITNIVHVFYEEGKLYTQFNEKNPKRLIAVSGKQFRRDNDPIATTSITVNDQGEIILQGDIGNYKKY
ncbi:MAG: serine hydrolase domain-containing protein [Pseudomonadota bacterium]